VLEEALKNFRESGFLVQNRLGAVVFF